MEILYTETNKVKLTITPNRITLKFPKNSTQETVDKFVGITNDIASKFKPTHSFRGRFSDSFIVLKNESGEKIRFKFES